MTHVPRTKRLTIARLKELLRHVQRCSFQCGFLAVGTGSILGVPSWEIRYVNCWMHTMACDVAIKSNRYYVHMEYRVY